MRACVREVGYGVHCSMRGALEDYKQEVKPPDDQRRHGSDKLRQACQLAFDEVLDAFRGKGVGVEAIEADPDVPRGKTRVLASGAASSGLSNSGHCDVRDSSRSFSVWTTSDPSIIYAQRRWWFFMPRNGLAIELGEGVAVSWDGRWVWHCSAVEDAHPCATHLSFFAGMKLTTCGISRRLREWEWAWESSASGHWLSSLPLAIGDRVWLRRVLPGGGLRRDSGFVLCVTESEVKVGWGKEGLASSVEAFPAACLVDMVRAGAICRACELSGMQVVGRRVSVYWPMDDECFDGVVQSFDGERHTILYDDAMILAELLGSEDSPSYRVLD